MSKLGRWLPSLVAVVVLVGVVWYAVLAVGFPVRQLDLNDTGIWISNDASGEYGRVNKAVGSLDARLSPPGSRLTQYELDILQDGNAVLGWDQSNSALTRVDTALGRSMADQDLAADPSNSVQLRGGTLAMMDRSGRVWATRYDRVSGSVDLSGLGGENRPLAELGLAADAAAGAAALAVGVDGTVYAAAINGRLITIRPAGGGFSEPEVAQRAVLKSAEVTAVGDAVVVLDAVQKQLILPSGKAVGVETDEVSRLQEAGPSADGVLLASARALLRVDLDSGAVTTVDAGGDGDPAAPVRLAGCDFGTWAGVGRVVRACDGAEVEVQQVDRSGGLIRPVFRINHTQLLLNDRANGRAYDLDTKSSVDNWPDLHPQGSGQEQEQEQAQADEAKPKAVDDFLKARTERTTVLHLLDNDTDTAGGILSIKKINAAGVPEGADLEISPDGQTVKLYLPDSVSQVRFTYVVSNGRVENEGNVVVSDAGDQQTPPKLRPGVSQSRYSTPSFGNLSIPVISDWRDGEGDPVTLLSAVDGSSPVPVTTDGQLDYTADGPDRDVVRTLTYQVSDGADSKPVKAAVKVKVLGLKSTTMVAPVAQPDIARGEVGKPISVYPLANDVPGADPRNLNAKLALNAQVAQKANLKVTTDDKTGRVVVVATREGPYYLNYSLAYGNAAVARGIIRVDVLPASDEAGPVAMPDQAAIRGRAPVLVDVLGNDYDPAGDLLTVQAADPAEPGQVQAQVVAGRWLRILPQTEDLSPNPQAIHYTISNGSQTATGDVLVTQLDEVDQDVALVRKDTAVVRAGDSVLIPVLTNDSSLSGQPLKLITDGVGGGADGQLPVLDPARASDADQGDVGTAYVRGDQVRYVAPAVVDGSRQVVISYTASTSTGESAQGQVLVTIKAQPSADDPDQAPVGGTVEMRAVSGSRVKITIPTSGQDPDGDSVTVTGIASAPSLGRVVGISANSLIYEAYPTAGLVGTDTFRYVITDAYGRTGLGSVRVAVTEPGQTQPPVAIDDQITVAPGVGVSANVMANDLISRDDDVSIASLARLNQPLAKGVSLGSAKGPIAAKGPGLADQPVLFNYALVGNGGTGPAATVKIVAKAGFNNPPVITDQVAEAEGSRGKVNLVTNAWDVEDDVAELKVKLLTEVAGAQLVGSQLQVPLLDRPQTIPFQVTDSGGAVSAAVVYVPPAGQGAPKLKSDASIQLAMNTTASFAIGDYVESPRSKAVRISSAEIDSSPAGNLAARVDDSGKFTLTSSGDYTGPASVTIEVMDADSQTADGVLKATIAIPVQIGAPTPVLRCPEDVQTIVQGGEIKNLDITTLCHVWSPNPDTLNSLTYTTNWSKPVSGVSASSGEHKVNLQAAGSAPENAVGELSVGIAGTTAKVATINVEVLPAAAPSMRSVKFSDIKAGTPVPVPISLLSPLLDAQTKVVKVEKVAGGEAKVADNGASLTITPGTETSGILTFRVTATDLATDPGRESRWASGTITLSVYSKPDPPSTPIPGQVIQSHAATLSWTPGAANGAAIDSYEVKASTGTVTTCRATPCQITGLANAKPVTFKVRAHNKADYSDWSKTSKSVTPDTAPGAPAWVKVSDPRDRSVLLSWGKISNDGSKIKNIHIYLNGQGTKIGAGRNSIRVKTPSNNEAYTFGVAAENNYKAGPTTTARGQSSGRPAGLVVATPIPGALVGPTTNVIISWTLASPEGPQPVTYSLVRSDGKKICTNTTAQSCTDDTVSFSGATYTYKVTATNATGGEAHSTTATSPPWQATGTPDNWAANSIQAAATGADGKVKITYKVPPSRGMASTLTLYRSGKTYRLTSPGVNGGTGTYTATGLNDGTKYTFTLRVTNEAGRYTNSGPAAATPFGKLGSAKITSATVSGTKITAKATANGNGASATLTLYIGGVKIKSSSGKGSLSVSGSRSNLAYSTTYTVKATLTTGKTTPTRSNGGSTSVTRRTGAKPPTPKVVLSVGDLQIMPPYLPKYLFRKVYLKTKYFPGEYTCKFYGVSRSPLTFNENVSGYYTNVYVSQDSSVGSSSAYVVCGGIRSNTVHA